jgi:hypothetical protein
LGRSARRLAVAVSGVVALSACTTRTVSPGGQGAEVFPVLSVERFLAAANARDFEAMRRLFGTYRGPIDGERLEIERRMALISDILKHQDYEIMGEQMEAGREHPTTRVTVELTQCGGTPSPRTPCPPGGRVIPYLPFLVVRTEDGGWLVEQVDLERITAPR